MFYFQSMFLTVYNNINQSAYLSQIQIVAEAILLLAALFAVYEAYSRGGDVRGLALVGVRYLIMGLVITQYPNVFININYAFNNVAGIIQPNDVLTGFREQIAEYLGSNSGVAAWWEAIPGGVAGLISLVFQLLTVMIFPITYAIFAFFYCMYGSVLYVCGPLILGLYPAMGVGQLARTYMVNLLIWNAWGIIYAIFTQLLTAMGANSLNSVLTQQSFGGLFQGGSQMLLLSLSGILLALMIALIPFIANRVVSGELGSTLFAVLGVAAAAIQTAVFANAGMLAGSRGGSDASPISPPPGDHSPAPPPDSYGSAASGGSSAPRGPQPHGMYQIPYGLGWAAGRAAKAAKSE